MEACVCLPACGGYRWRFGLPANCRKNRGVSRVAMSLPAAIETLGYPYRAPSYALRYGADCSLRKVSFRKG
jgi:hypothetical protein